jgi:putative flavoprotein involved in K+ transport
MVEAIDTVIIGGGQAGLSVSYYLTKVGREHLILEKSNRPGNAWRNQRWDSFTLVTPNWTFQLPGGEYQGDDPNGFMKQNEIVQRFEDYIEQYHLPVVYNSLVTKVEPRDGGGYCVQTSEIEYHAVNVVIANGFFQEGKVPDFATKIPGPILQMHSGSFRNPHTLPQGAVLVVGSGQSGMQIAEEIYRSGRKVFLATSGAPRAPRRYREKDIFDWLYLSGFFDQTFENFISSGRRKFVPPHVTGKDGGYALNLHQFFRDGVTLLGHARNYEDGKLLLAGDLKENLSKSDGGEKMLLKNIDDFILRAGVTTAQEQIPVLADAYQAPEITTLDLLAEGITTIIWASGYQYDASIFPFPILNEFGFPVTQRGVSHYPGLYFVGIPFIPKLKSGFLFGVAEDAAYIVEQITHQQ